MKTILPSRTAEILITQKCNLNCSYCFEKHKNGCSLDFKEFRKHLGNGVLPFEQFYIFGGEPTLNMKFIEDAVKWINNNPKWPIEYKNKLIQSICNNLITNGIALEDLIPVFKKYKISLQISLDGPEDINDACRKDHAGNGHFQQIMHNIDLCKENGIPYTIHGAIAKENYKHFSRIIEWFLKMAVENPSKTENIANLENVFRNNFAQIVFEDEIDDDDIDILLTEFWKAVKMILETPLLNGYSDYTRKKIAVGLFNRRGGVCSAGITMFSYDESFKAYPCHRMTTNTLRNPLMSLDDDNEKKNFKEYKLYQDVARQRVMYGAFYTNYNFKGGCYFVNWCPVTNVEVSGDPFYLPPKHNVLIAELQRFIPQLADYFDLDLNM